jgi:hypothetical protein
VNQTGPHLRRERLQGLQVARGQPLDRRFVQPRRLGGKLGDLPLQLRRLLANELRRLAPGRRIHQLVQQAREPPAERLPLLGDGAVERRTAGGFIAPCGAGGGQAGAQVVGVQQGVGHDLPGECLQVWRRKLG